MLLIETSLVFVLKDYLITYKSSNQHLGASSFWTSLPSASLKNPCEPR
jgi:hypothetical protein